MRKLRDLNVPKLTFSTDNLEPNELVICDPNVLLESIYQLVAVSFGRLR